MRAYGRGNRSQNEGYNKALSIKQEFILIRIINRIAFSKIYYRLSIIFSVPNFLFRKVYDDPDTESSIIDKLWTTRFLTRNPELNIRFSKFLSFDRHYVHDIENILK
jgi:hypothetical protein